jgi:hypothetical protein
MIHKEVTTGIRAMSKTCKNQHPIKGLFVYKEKEKYVYEKGSGERAD